MYSSSVVKDLNLDSTDKVFDLIINDYHHVLAPEDLLIIRFSNVNNSDFYRMLYYYYLLDNNYNYINDYFNYKKLIEMMKSNNIEFYDYNLEKEFIKEKMREMSFLPMPSNRVQNIESSLFVGSRAKEKALELKLIR